MSTLGKKATWTLAASGTVLMLAACQKMTTDGASASASAASELVAEDTDCACTDVGLQPGAPGLAALESPTPIAVELPPGVHLDEDGALDCSQAPPPLDPATITVGGTPLSTILAKITVFSFPYVTSGPDGGGQTSRDFPGYMCGHFANGFYFQWKLLGLTGDQIFSFGCIPKGKSSGVGHAISIISVDSTTADAAKYCIVDYGAVRGCWVQTGGGAPNPPSWIMSTMYCRYRNSIGACIAAGGKPTQELIGTPADWPSSGANSCYRRALD